MNRLFKTIGWLIKFTLAVLLLLVAVSAIIIALEIKVELDPLRQPVALAVSKALDREVRLDGSISLVPTLWPTLEINDISIGNPEGWPGDEPLAKVDLVRLKLGIMPLLSGDLNVAEATAEGVTLNLISNAKGDGNWQFGEKDPVDEVEDKDDGDEPMVRLESIEDLDLTDIALHFRDEKLGKKISFRLAGLQGHAVEGEPFSLSFNGDLEGKPYRFDFTGGSLADLREKKLNWPVKLDGTLVNTPVVLEGELVREGKSQLKAGLTVGKLDAGATLAWLKVMDGMRMTVGGLTADLLLEGKDLTELLEKARIAIVLKDGQWNLESRDKKSSLPLRIKTGKVGVDPGKPLSILLDAQINESPVEILITGSTLLDYTREGEKLPLVVDLKLGGAEIKLSTQVARPIDTSNLAFRLDAKGDSIDGFDPLLGTDLPPLGPYSIKGGFALTPKGYEIHQLLLTVGDSRLAGEFALNAIDRPYRLDLSLHSKRLQLNDFDTGDWTSQDAAAGKGAGKGAENNESEKPPGPVDQQKVDRQKAEKKAKLRKLLSQETLSKINAAIEVKVDQVLSGADKLGDGRLVLKLDKAKLTLDPVHIGLPGGDANMSFLFHPQGDKGDIAVKALVNHFDYGVLARRIDPKSDISGHLSLDVDLSAHITDPKALLENARGHFDFGLWPGDMDASLFDMWAVNVVSSLMSEVDKSEHSKVNCIVVGFTADAGVMQQKVIFADTSEMRIGGKAKVDFRKKTIEIYAAPKAKKPQFFSLATPVGMSGTFNEFGVSLNPIELTATAVSFITSPLHVPVRSLFSEDKEVDGEQACKIAWKAVQDDDLGAIPGAEGNTHPEPGVQEDQADKKPADEAVGIPDHMTY
jgi:uncharacterized protein involved in outer membrane biogenesis